MTALLLIIGLATLVAGAELLVRGASRLAAAAGISPLVIGLTVVAFGTSAPEMAASLGASLTGTADLALGNVVGSNVFNVFGILGLSALVAPLGVAVRLVRIDVPVLVVVSLVVVGMAADGGIARWEGLLLLAFIIGHTVWLVVAARREGRAAERNSQRPRRREALPSRAPSRRSSSASPPSFSAPAGSSKGRWPWRRDWASRSG